MQVCVCVCVCMCECIHVNECVRVHAYQLGVSPAVQDEVLRLQVSVDDAFRVQVGKGLHHARCVEPGGDILKRPPGYTQIDGDRL